eukprot:7328491-Prymnesium_polylepis.1
MARLSGNSRTSNEMSRTYARACPRRSVSECWKRPEREWGYGVTPEMIALADATRSTNLSTSIIAAFLTGAPNTHLQGSSFRASKSKPEETLAMYVRNLLMRSPGLCEPNVTVHVVHDLNASDAQLSALAGSVETRDDLLKVRWHRFAPDDETLGSDRRWELFAHVLHRTPWDCAYAIDLSDVMVLRVPPCAALPPKLLASSDGNVKPWLRDVTRLTRWNMSTDYWRMLHDSQPVISCAVVGGRREIFAAALDSVAMRMQERTQLVKDSQ